LKHALGLVPRVADEFLLLRIDRDRGLAGGDRGFDRGVDVAELRVAVWVVAALARLLIGLATVFQLAQQVRDNALTGGEALRRQGLDQVPQAAADPAQGGARVATDRVLDQRHQRRRQAGLVRDGTLAATAAAAHPAADQVASRPQLLDAAIDRAARQAGRGGNDGDAAAAVRQHLVRREQSAPPLVEKGLRALEAVTDVGGVDHIPRLPPRRRVAPSRIGILFVRSSIYPDSLITRRFLS